MRTGGWISLFLSFVIGIICARTIAYFFLNTKPVEIVYQGPTVKILIAQKEIPLGTEITADYVAFKDVPVNEIPEQAITDFMQVYRRKPAYPLIHGCPICEDLLLRKTNAENSTAEYLPAGSQIVSLEIGNLRIGNNIIETDKPLTEFFSDGNKVDIRIVPQQAETGEFIRLKNFVIDKYSSIEGSDTVNESGNIVLENVPIHHLNAKKVSADGKKNQYMSLLLENGQVEKLTAAAREGRLRIVPHQKQTGTANETQTKYAAKLTEIPVMENFRQNSEIAVETFVPAELQVQQEPAPLKQPVRLLDSAVSFSQFSEPENKTSENTAAVSIAVPAVKTVSMTAEVPKKTDISFNKISNDTSDINDISDITVNKISGVQKGIEIGLSVTQRNDYSPFRYSDAKQQTGEEYEKLSEPLPLKAKFR